MKWKSLILKVWSIFFSPLKCLVGSVSVMIGRCWPHTANEKITHSWSFFSQPSFFSKLLATKWPKYYNAMLAEIGLHDVVHFLKNSMLVLLTTSFEIWKLIIFLRNTNRRPIWIIIYAMKISSKDYVVTESMNNLFRLELVIFTFLLLVMFATQRGC